jgi:anti-sigma factor RsiW
MGMNPHLSERQISAWALGERDAEVGRHADACAACRVELVRVGEALAAFRQSARQWGEREMEAGVSPDWTTEPSRPWITFGRLRWACAVAALSLCVGVTATLWRDHRPAARDAAAADAMLLKQVDADVSQAVPDSMEPLLKLVSWNGSGSSNGSAQE